MAPILGIYASQISGHLFAPSGAYDSIATTTVGAGGSSSITFSSIPATYTHLQIRYIVKNASAAYYLKMRYNSDTGSNYSWHLLSGDGDAVTATATASTTDMVLPRTADSALANAFTAGVVDILDYANTSKYKTSRALGGFSNNSTDGGVQKIELSSGLWMNTNAVSSITLFPGTDNFTQYSQIALYGIKGN